LDSTAVPLFPVRAALLPVSLAGAGEWDGLVAIAALAAEAAAAALVAATAEATVFLGARLIDVECPASDILTVQFGNGLIAFGVIRHLDETEAAGLAGIAIRYDTDAVNRPIRFKEGANRFLRDSVAQVSYKYILHQISSCYDGLLCGMGFFIIGEGLGGRIRPIQRLFFGGTVRALLLAMKALGDFFLLLLFALLFLLAFFESLCSAACHDYTP